MFEAKLAQGALFKKIVEALKDILHEVSLECSADGMNLQAMDNSHVALVSLLLKSEAFDRFKCSRNLNLGLSLQSLSKVLKCAANEDKISIKAEDDPDSIAFCFESPKQDRVSNFEIKLMDLDTDHLAIPDTEYSCVIRIPSAEFGRICRDLSILGDTINICCTKDGAVFSAQGDMGSGSIKLKQSGNPDRKEEAVIIEIKSAVTLTFSLRYLTFFTKAVPLSSQVILSLSEDVPLMVEFKIENSDDENIGYLRYYLAPKVEEE